MNISLERNILKVSQRELCPLLQRSEKLESFAMLKISLKFNFPKSIIEPYFDYCSIVWDTLGNKLTEKL